MITFDKEKRIFKIETRNTVYAMKIVHDKFMAHLYYGKKTDDVAADYVERAVDFAPYVAEVGIGFSLETTPTELSFFDSGDLRDTAVKLQNANGDCTTLFYYKDYRIFKGRVEFDDMPYSRGGDETLELIYVDEVSGCVLHSYYTVFEQSDTITRYQRYENKGNAPLCIRQAASCQLELDDREWTMITLCGKYAKERNLVEYPAHLGIQRIYSKRGHSSHHFNPFMALKTKDTSENSGDAYAFEFVYSGDFESQTELTFDKKARVMMGLNRDTFAWNLAQGETFTTPEVVMTYSACGLNKLSQNLHDHIRGYIIPSKFVNSKRPVVINTWEAVYFNIDENVLSSYAEKAKELGIDTLVIDDGWFGSRNNDSQGLGDWFVNREKFQNGLAAFSDKVHDLGLRLGIWIEPEMINPKSELYKAHPEWVLQCKNRPSSLGRKQLVLDLTNDEVINYIVDTIKRTLSGVKLEYIKWDFNRTLSEVGSLALPPEKQCEVKHRFVLGTYKMHKLLTQAFPNVLFEGCSGGGGRFDAGILFYCPQIWASDNTDPVARMEIQKGTAFAYPISSISAHVSNSRSNKLEISPDYEFRFNVALGGMLGYEMNITRLSKEDEEKIKRQVAKYDKWYGLLLTGDQYRLKVDGGEYAFVCVAKDKSEFLFVYQDTENRQRRKLSLVGLDENAAYVCENGNTYSGKTLREDGIDVAVSKLPYGYFSCYGKRI